jgi:hypothetical protein
MRTHPPWSPVQSQSPRCVAIDERSAISKAQLVSVGSTPARVTVATRSGEAWEDHRSPILLNRPPHDPAEPDEGDGGQRCAEGVCLQGLVFSADWLDDAT